MGVVSGQPTSLTLPKEIDIAGQVTIGGKRYGATESSIRVRAAFQGDAHQARWLSVEITPQPNGSFSLTGLTPGTYIIQATRDDIWLSKSMPVTVTQDDERSLITLDIPPPGAAMLLHFADSGGKPVVDTSLTFALPTGPLTDEIWPKDLRTDGNGGFRFDGFSAGQQRVTVGGSSYVFSVPPYAAQRAPVSVPIQTN